MKSLRLRPLLLAHVEDVVTANEVSLTNYNLFRALIRSWLSRESARIGKYHAGKPSVDDLWQACSMVAWQMEMRMARTITNQDVETLIEKYSPLSNLPKLDFGGRSLLNRNSSGEYRFAHYTIQEFFIAHAIERGNWVGPVRATLLILQFLSEAVDIIPLNELSVTGIRKDELSKYKFADRLKEGGMGPTLRVETMGKLVGVGTTPIRPVDLRDTPARGIHTRSIAYDEYGEEQWEPLVSGWESIGIKDYADWLCDQTGKNYTVALGKDLMSSGISFDERRLYLLRQL